MKTKTLVDAPLNQELIDLLNELFPEKCPNLNDSERTIFFYAGQRKLVSMLTEVWELQKRQLSNEQLSRRKADTLAGMSL